jgi:hypothetical protein
MTWRASSIVYLPVVTQTVAVGQSFTVWDNCTLCFPGSPTPAGYVVFEGEKCHSACRWILKKSEAVLDTRGLW